ncbi:Outer membrane protein beta-barrel domain-containing protein [Reichenbachiella faecimaris]|uniref:Outer membrane protein beta-barrel domain-containing protein n=1 Tax=Reichenbachiella faecimaris TaxID=692418 RepID=A0A1W2GKH0_REIFA|nr:porin family protein [Reichenbachiella faecimaris]SMD37054.1 Outer membrane protein beta-barrel domain-containing protein [Reichenbachiella faecimaris]
MKKSLFIIALLLVSQLMYAQSRSRSRSRSRTQVQTEFGVMGGVNFNSPKINALNTGGSELSDVGTGNIGFHVGIYATIDAELFAIQPEIYYSMQGGKYKINNTQEHEFKLNMIQIPVLGRYNFLEYFHALAGPQFGIPIQAEVSFSGGSGVDVKDQIKGLDVAAVIGIGLTIPEYNVSGSLRWSKGFSEMIEEAGTSAGSVTSMKNSMIQISASYAFGDK